MKTIKCMVVLLLSSWALLPEAEATQSFTGFSAGLAAGYSFANSSLDRTLILTGVSDSNSNVTHGFLGGLTLGYGYQFQNSMFLGLEAMALFGSMNGKTQTTVNLGQPIETHLNQKHKFGAAVQLGYALQNVLPYLKAGIAFSQFQSTTNALPLIGSGSISKYRVGLDLGLGVRISLNKMCSLGLEYSHVEYQDLKYTANNNLGVSRININVKPRDNLITLIFRTSW